MSEDGVVYIDGRDMIMGRLASKVAKMLLEGRRVVVLYAEDIIVTGTSKRSIMEKFYKRLRLRSNVNPRRHGPFIPRSPEGIFRRVVRGMLPRNKPKGKEAYKRLKVYRDNPYNVSSEKLVVFEDARRRKFNPYPYMYLKEIAKLIGWVPVEERVKRWVASE